MDRGYVKLWRKSKDSGMLADHSTWCLWCYLLMEAAYKPTRYWACKQTIVLEPGQLVSGRNKLSEDLSLSPQKIRTSLGKLVAAGNITIKSTNKYSIISIVNWHTYQQPESEINQQATSKQPASNQQATTVKEGKKESRKELEEPPIAPQGGAPVKPAPQKTECPHQEIIDLFHVMLPELPRVRTWNETERRALAARWNTKGQNNMRFWEDYFANVSTRPFLMGKVKDFRATLKWLVGRDNMSKVMSDYYQSDQEARITPKMKRAQAENNKAKELLGLFGGDEDVE